MITNKNKIQKLPKKDDPDMTSAFLVLAQAIERNTEVLEKLVPEFKKTETVKRLTKNRKKHDADARSALDEMGL